VIESVQTRTLGRRVQPVTALARAPDLEGKVVVVTGGTDGVGRALVEQLAKLHATVVFTARNPEKGARVRGEVVRSTGNEDVEVVTLDLADLASVRDGAETIRARHPRLDLLIANAAHQAGKARTVTADGFETTFGVNHVGHALLISLLEEPLRAGAPSRVLVVASEAHRRARGGLDFDDLMMSTGRFRPKLAYSRSKLANILYARELAFRLDGSGVDVNAAHPGGVDTPMMRSNFERPAMRRLYPLLRDHLFISADDAGAGLLRVALDPALAGTSGAYFELGCPARPTDAALDDRAAQRLWSATEELLGRGARR
jgi:NAD(P)-dependent dehydrogenase (short-subunit alcohol dehydrogenase family)